MVNLTDPPTPSPEAATEVRLIALEHQLAALDGRLQLAEEQKLTLETRMVGLAAEVEQLRETAGAIRTLEEAALARAGFDAQPRPRRPRHLTALAGGAS